MMKHKTILTLAGILVVFEVVGWLITKDLLGYKMLGIVGKLILCMIMGGSLCVIFVGMAFGLIYALGLILKW